MIDRLTARTAAKLLQAVVILLAILAAGTIGYHWLDPQVGWFDSFYMTVITISTVGFGEVSGLTPAGRVLTVFLILAGIGLVSYVFLTISKSVVEGRLRDYFGRRKLDKRIASLKGHVILCGFGQVGEIVAAQLRRYGKPFVVVERDETLVTTMDEDDYIYVIGDATRDEILQQAGIERCWALIATANPDSTNIFITLTARELNPEIKILSRAFEKEAEKRLLRAGADRIIYPDRLGGMRITLSLLRPALISFLEVLSISYAEGEVEVDEVTIGEHCSMLGKTLMDAQIRQDYNLIILAIRQADGSMRFNPHRDTLLSAGDTLISIGTRNDLDAFARRMDAREIK